MVTESAESSGEDTRSKELYAYHFVKNVDDFILLWKINDFIKDCPVDLTLDYINKSLLISDLDNNGIAESIFLYRMSCKGDVSPDDMKLIMHEDKNKFAIRGRMEMSVNGNIIEEGSFKIDNSFSDAPEIFLTAALDQWKNFNAEKIGN